MKTTTSAESEENFQFSSLSAEVVVFIDGCTAGISRKFSLFDTRNKIDFTNGRLRVFLKSSDYDQYFQRLHQDAIILVERLYNSSDIRKSFQIHKFRPHRL